MESYQTIFFDFDGVLCKDRFFTILAETYPEVYAFTQTHIFSKYSDIPNKWMKNEMTMYDVNKYISEQTGIEYNIILNLFEKSIKNMTLNHNLINIALQLKQQGKNIAIVTNNMDCFTSITISHHKLDEIFPHIINSSDYGILKQEENGKLFDIAMDKVGCREYKSTLLIDDSQTARDTFEKKGGHTFAYSDFETFKQWSDIYLL